jgi:hypothetical protein
LAKSRTVGCRIRWPCVRVGAGILRGCLLRWEVPRVVAIAIGVRATVHRLAHVVVVSVPNAETLRSSDGGGVVREAGSGSPGASGGLAWGMAVLLVVRFERLAAVGRDRQLTRAGARRPVRVRPLRSDGERPPASATWTSGRLTYRWLSR